MHLRFTTAGESHGKALVAIVEGVPAGLPIDIDAINHELRRRQQGYGRGGRMKIETDTVEILSGIRHGKTLGSPIALIIKNDDFLHWKDVMSVSPPSVSSPLDNDVDADVSSPRVSKGSATESPNVRETKNRRIVTRPRPGHADLAGGQKFQTRDLRDILERASARETAARVACGAIAKQLLAAFGIEIRSHVIQLGGIPSQPLEKTWNEITGIAADSALNCADANAEQEMIAAIDKAKTDGDTLGGIFEVVAAGVPVGLGSHTSWDEKLDGRVARAIMSIHAVKAVEVGEGVANAARRGSQVHDEIFLSEPPASAGGQSEPHAAAGGLTQATQDAGASVEQLQPPDTAGGSDFCRRTNRAGGLEGGITNGEELRVRGYMKPISTLRKPLASVDIDTKQPSDAAFERSDITAVPAAGVIGEAMLAITLANAMREKFGGDSVAEIRRNFDAYALSLNKY